MKTIRLIIYYSIWYPVVAILLRSSHRSRVLIYSGSDRLLCVKGRLSNGKWQLPGGGIKRYETSNQGARREVEEEVGISLKNEDLKFIKDVKYKFFLTSLNLSLFRVNLKQPVEPKIRTLEISQAQWVKLSELNQKTADRELLFCLESLLQ